MKKLTSAAMIVVGAILASQSGNAQIIPNDLYMGFQNFGGGGSSDYIVNLGSATSIVTSSGYVYFNNDFSMTSFNSVLGASSSMFVGVVGGSNAGNPSDIYLTQLRTGGNPYPGNPGSSISLSASKIDDNNAFADISSLNGPAVGTGVLDSSKSWEADVESQPNTEAGGTLWGDTGLNPDSAIGTSSVLYEDLWETSSSSFAGSPYTYLGYFTIDMTGASPDVYFTPDSVPEPGTALIAGISGLALMLIRRRTNKNA